MGAKSLVSDADDGIGRLATDAKLSGYSLAVCIICFLVGIVEGFDYAAAAFAVPLIGREWGVSSAALGWVFTTAALGAILGNIFLAPLGDKWGRRPAVVLNLLLTALATGAGGLTTSVEGLALTRLFCGIGVGGLYPNLIAIGIEHLPLRLRSIGAMIIACSMPVGLSISGFVSGPLGATHGWPAIFYCSAGLSLVIVSVAAIALPESPHYLIRFPRHSERGRRLMQRAFPGVDIAEAEVAALSTAPSADDENVLRKFAVLLSPAYRTVSLLIWTIFFLTMIMNYFFSGWLPTALAKEGMPIEAATQALSIFTIGGLVGSLVTSAAQSRYNQAVALSSCYLIAIASLTTLGLVPLVQGWLLSTTMFFVGWGIFGGQFALIVMTGSYYSTHVRSTALGAATAVGRSGGVIISLLGGFLLAADVTPSSIFAMLAGPGLLALFAVLGLWQLSRRQVANSRQAELHPAE